jgi:WD40 repeat protein
LISFDKFAVFANSSEKKFKKCFSRQKKMPPKAKSTGRREREAGDNKKAFNHAQFVESATNFPENEVLRINSYDTTQITPNFNGPVRGGKESWHSAYSNTSSDFLALGYSSGILAVYKNSTATVEHLLIQKNQSIGKCCFSHDDKYIYCISYDNLWTVELVIDPAAPLSFSLRHVSCIKKPHGNLPVMCLAVSPDGNFLVTGTTEIKIFDIHSDPKTPKEIRKITRDSAASYPNCPPYMLMVGGLIFSRDSKFLFGAGQGPLVHCWDVSTGQEVRRPINVYPSIRRTELPRIQDHNDDTDYFVIDGEGVLTLTEEEVQNHPGAQGHTAALRRIKSDPQPDPDILIDTEEKIAAFQEKMANGTMLEHQKVVTNLWSTVNALSAEETQNKAHPTTLPLHSVVFISALALSPNGKFLVSGSRFGNYQLRVIEVEKWKVLEDIDDTTGGLPPSNGETEHIAKRRFHWNWVSSLTFLPNPNHSILFSGSFDASVKVWDLERKSLIACIKFGHGTAKELEVLNVSVAPNGNQLAVSVFKNGITQLFSVEMLQ